MKFKDELLESKWNSNVYISVNMIESHTNFVCFFLFKRSQTKFYYNTIFVLTVLFMWILLKCFGIVFNIFSLDFRSRGKHWYKSHCLGVILPTKCTTNAICHWNYICVKQRWWNLWISKSWVAIKKLSVYWFIDTRVYITSNMILFFSELGDELLL